MGTACEIGYLKEDEFFVSIGCFCNGYLDYVGNILLDCYNTYEKVDNLINFGNLYSLGTSLEDCMLSHYQDDYDPPVFSYVYVNNKWYWQNDSYDEKKLYHDNKDVFDMGSVRYHLLTKEDIKNYCDSNLED